MDLWPPSVSGVLFFWEAFVSGTAHSDSGVRDAATAARYFLENENNLQRVNAISAEDPLSLIGAAAIWSGWVNNPSYLHKPVLVLKPNEPFDGRIHNIDC